MNPLYPLATLLLVASLLVGFASASPIAWGPYIAIQMSSSTWLQSSQTLYLDSFSFGSESVLLNNVYINSGQSIRTLNFSSSYANVTLNRLSLSGETSLTVEGNGTTPIYLVGFGQSPTSVLSVANASVPYFYSSSNDTLLLNPTITISDTILLSFSEASIDSVMGIAVIALLIGVTIASVALIFALRRRRENED
jgi:hypothetical protein